jgi:hypothetical protein
MPTPRVIDRVKECRWEAECILKAGRWHKLTSNNLEVEGYFLRLIHSKAYFLKLETPEKGGNHDDVWSHKEIKPTSRYIGHNLVENKGKPTLSCLLGWEEEKEK